MILEPIWESDFSIHSYGFRPNRSTYDAISAIYLQLIGSKWTYQWIIEGDIASYFDTIPHQKLIKVVKKRVADKDIHEGLWRFLRAGVMYRGQFTETLTGTPQGGIVSPLLANIYLDQLDKYMETISLNLTYSLFQMTLHSFLSHTTLIHTRNFTTIILTPRHPPYPLASNGLLRSAHQRRQTDTSLVWPC